MGALVGTKVSTPFLIHGLALAAFLVPQALIHLSRNPSVSPFLDFALEVFASLVNLLVYRGENYKPQDTSELDEYLPESSSANLENLDITNKSATNDQDDSLNMLLAPTQSIPSHDDVDLLGAANPDLESDLLPCAKIEHDVSDEDEVEGPAAGDLAAGLEAADSDTDSAEGAFSLATSVATTISSYMPSATDTLLPAATQVLGNLVKSSQETDRTKRATSEPDLEDFELISEDDLKAASP